jgi:hypothetical protein
MTRLTKVLSTVALSTATTLAIAHPGHDHTAPTSALIHVLFYGAIFAVGVAAVWFAVRSVKNKTH